MKIGNKIRNIRLNKRMTLKELSQKVSLTKSFLSQLERGRTSPSVNSLEKIAQALDTKVACFFEDKEDKPLIFIKKRNDREVFDQKKKILCQTLASGLLNIGMQPQIFHIAGGAKLTKELGPLRGEKLGMVLKGTLEFFFQEKQLKLEKGDSIYCSNTTLPYKIINQSKNKSQLLWVILRRVSSA
ncbi:MAG: XRE family transcriptional regulator [Candidatus Omnitrophota bacterium]